MESYGTAYKTAYGTSMNLRLRLLAECDVCVAPGSHRCRVTAVCARPSPASWLPQHANVSRACFLSSVIPPWVSIRAVIDSRRAFKRAHLSVLRRFLHVRSQVVGLALDLGALQRGVAVYVDQLVVGPGE